MKHGRSTQTVRGVKRDCKWFTMRHFAPAEYGARCMFFDKFIEFVNCEGCEQYESKTTI